MGSEYGAKYAADTDTLGRPKVAVVLSGGGAKGMAHIGVLHVLERAGIPIDIITGSSADCTPSATTHRRSTRS